MGWKDKHKHNRAQGRTQTRDPSVRDCYNTTSLAILATGIGTFHFVKEFKLQIEVQQLNRGQGEVRYTFCT